LSVAKQREAAMRKREIRREGEKRSE